MTDPRVAVAGIDFDICYAISWIAPVPHVVGPDGPRMLLVDKHHVVRFASGRQVPVLLDPDGTRFVLVIEAGEGKASLAVPDGWKLECVEPRPCSDSRVDAPQRHEFSAMPRYVSYCYLSAEHENARSFSYPRFGDRFRAVVAKDGRG